MTKPIKQYQNIPIEFEPKLKAWLHLEDERCPECHERFVIPSAAFFADCTNRKYDGGNELGCPIAMQVSGKKAKGDPISISEWTDGKLWVNLVSFNLRNPNNPNKYYFIACSPSIKDFRFYTEGQKVMDSQTIPTIPDFSYQGLIQQIKLWMTFS